MFNDNELLNEAFSSPVDYILDNEKSDIHNKYYLFQINGSNYRVNISRINSTVKTSYMFTLGSLSPKGSMIQFKFRHKDIYIAISTAIKIFREWYDINKNLFSSVVFKLPDKITSTQIKIVEKLIKKQKIQTIEKIPLKAPDDAKHKYVFYKNKKKADDVVLKGLFWKGFNEYGFEDAFPAELLDELLLKTKLEKSHVIDQLNLMSKGFNKVETAFELGKQVTAQELKVLDQKKDAIEKIEKEVEELTSEGAKQKVLTDKDMEYHWNKTVGLKKKVETINLLISKLNKYSDGLQSFYDYLSREKKKEGDDSVEYKYLNVWFATFSEMFSMWNFSENQDNANFLDRAFFELPLDYVKYFDFHVKNFEQYQMYTPYIFYGNKKLVTDKILKNPKQVLMETPKINGFYSKLAANLGSQSSIGRLKHEGTQVYFFPALFERWDFVNFLRDIVKSGEGYSKGMLDNLSDNAYYEGSTIENKQNEKIEQSGVTVLSFIPLKGIQEPQPINNIFNTTEINEVRKQLLSKQKKNCSVENVPSIISYTGSGYGYLNGGFRDKNVAKSRQEGLMEFLKEYKKYAVKLGSDIEVSRKTNFPTELELDRTYVDFSPLSTSIAHSVWSGSIKMRIKIPKQSSIFIAMGSFSNHPNEKEIILPPGSIIKPYRHVTLDYNGEKWTECILMGNVFQHVYDTILMINEPEKQKNIDDEISLVDFDS